MATKKRSNSTRKKASRSKAKTSRKSFQIPTLWIEFFLKIFFLFLGILAVFRLGIIGKFGFGLFDFLFGYLGPVLLIILLGYLVLSLIRKTEWISAKTLIIGSLLLLGILLILNVGFVDDTNPFASVRYFFSLTGSILTGNLITVQGLLGLIPTALLTVLISRIGVIIAAVIIICLSLIGWLFKYKDQFLTFLQSRAQKKKTKISKKAESSEKFKEIDSIYDIEELDFDEEPVDNEKDLDFLFQTKFPTERPVKSKPAPVAKTEKKITPVLKEKKTYPGYKVPGAGLLNSAESGSSSKNIESAKENGKKLIAVLNQFRVQASLVDIHIGPTVTQFELALTPGVRVSSITQLQSELKMALAAKDIRIEAPIPGKSAIGIEIPNAQKVMVSMKEGIEKIAGQKGALPFCLGKDLYGNYIYGHLESMPHLLIAGATGSGKSVCVNSIISSLLLTKTPDECKLLLIDPKKVEFSSYNGIAHLIAPVITEPDKANFALKKVVSMMDERYALFEKTHVRNIEGYNKLAESDPEIEPLSRIVVIIDELADLMLVAAKEVEQSIQRITQLARAAGIHLIVATQRPSVNVITGIIKANIPSRIAFMVSSGVDSRTILDQAGAEKLLGYGDMLFLDNGESNLKRIQGVYIQDEEVNKICEWIKDQMKPEYDDTFFIETEESSASGANPISDPLYEQVKEFVISSKKASTSLIQRHFSIGYARAARIMDSLEKNGVIGPSRGAKPREVYMNPGD